MGWWYRRRRRRRILLLSRYNGRFFRKDVSKNCQKIKDVGLLHRTDSSVYYQFKNWFGDGHSHPRTLPTPPSMDDRSFLVGQHADQVSPSSPPQA
jgi:hypothetical protein